MCVILYFFVAFLKEFPPRLTSIESEREVSSNKKSCNKQQKQKILIYIHVNVTRSNKNDTICDE